MTQVITISMLLADSGNSKSPKVDSLTLAQSLNKFIFEKGFILDTGVESWLMEGYLNPLARAIQSFGSQATESARTAYYLIDRCLKENKRKRKKSSGRVPIAA